MSIQISTLKCPTCTDQLMDTVTTALGALERCPSCYGLWIEQKLIAAYSDDKATCREALDETKALLLPVERWCPKCFQKMFDGRVRSRGVVLHLCTHCEAIWTDWDTLQRFDEFIARALKAQVETATQASVSPPQKQFGAAFGGTPLPSIEDTGVAKVFRGIARTFDSMADGVASTSSYPLPAPRQKPAVRQPPAKPGKGPAKEKEKGRKILKADELPPVEAPPAAETTAAPLVPATPPVVEKAPAPEIKPIAPEPVVPLAPIPELNVPEIVLPPEPEPQSEPEPARTPAPASSSQLPDLMSMLEALEALEAQRRAAEAIATPPPDAPEIPAVPIERPAPVIPEPIPVEPEPLKPVAAEAPQIQEVEKKVEPAPEPEPVKEPAKEPAENAASAISSLLGGSSWQIPDEKQKPKTKETPPAPVKKPILEPIAAELKSESAPAKPVPIATKKPVPVAKPAVAKAPKKEGPGALGRLFSALKPKPKPPKVAKPAPIAPAPVVKAPVVEPPKVEVPAPVASKPAPVAPKPAAPKPSVKPKSTEPKKTSGPSGIALRLLPWGLAIVAFLINYARGYDFELSFALLWSTVGWAVGHMVRLAILYPFKEFMNMTVAAALEYPGLSPAKGLPILLEGVLEPEDPGNPKSRLVFVQDGQTLAVNTFGSLDLLCRFFGLQNPSQLIAGPVTLQGWFRKTARPYVEVALLIAGKKRRSSMVRALRWVCAALTLAIAALVLLTAE